MRFSSKKDPRLLAVVAVSLLAPVIVLFATPSSAQRRTALLFVLVFELPVLALLAWFVATTEYVFDGGRLIVRSGPVRWSVDLATLRRVRPTRNPMSAPALSLDRLELTYGRGSVVLVSPADRDAFLRALADRAPDAAFVGVSPPPRA